MALLRGTGLSAGLGGGECGTGIGTCGLLGGRRSVALRHKLVDSVRGPGGGYCIARPLELVPVADIIRAVDEQLDATQCGGRENCHDEHRCMTHDLWTTLNTKMFDYLASVTLADLVLREKQKRGASASVIEDKRRLGPQPRGRVGQKVPAVA